MRKRLLHINVGKMWSKAVPIILLLTQPLLTGAGATSSNSSLTPSTLITTDQLYPLPLARPHPRTQSKSLSRHVGVSPPGAAPVKLADGDDDDDEEEEEEEDPTVPRFGHSLNDKQILDRMLHHQRYDKRIKPAVQPLHVNVSVVLLSLSSPDESSLHYEVEFFMQQKWTDPRLAFTDKRNREYLNALAHHKYVWKPDVYILKHGSYKSINPTEVSLKIYTNGTVFYTMRRHLVLNCEGDLHIFPFDSPMCTFSIESVSSPRSQMEFFWTGPNRVATDADSGSVASSPLLKRLNAYLIHNETMYCHGEEWRGDYSCLKVRLHFTRDKWFYYTTVFVPGLILVTSSFVTFWIEWNAEPARVMLGVTTMLNFFTTSNKFRSNLPVVSNLTAMNMWDGVCMFFIYASFLEFIVVNYLARWVQDPDTMKKKRDNAILDSLRIVATTLDMKHPENAGTLGAQLHNLGGNFESKLKEVKDRIPPELAAKVPLAGVLKSDATVTPPIDDTELEEAIGPLTSPPTTRGSYTLNSVKKIDTYSRRIFPCTYILFVLYFFIRYHHIEGALSIEY